MEAMLSWWKADSKLLNFHLYNYSQQLLFNQYRFDQDHFFYLQQEKTQFERLLWTQKIVPKPSIGLGNIRWNNWD